MRLRDERRVDQSEGIGIVRDGRCADSKIDLVLVYFVDRIVFKIALLW